MFKQNRLNKLIMIKFLKFILFFLTFPISAAESNIDFIDRVVAVVNGEIILASDLQYESINTALQSGKGDSKEITEIYPKNKLLDKMINEMILLQRAKTLQISIDDFVLQRVIQDIAKRAGTNIDNLKKKLSQQGLSFSRFKKNIEKELIFTRLREVELESRLRISESEIDLFLEFHANNNLSNEEVLISQYKVPFEKDIDSESKNELKNNIKSKLKELKLKSQNKSLEDEIVFANFENMGWRSFDRIPKVFINAIKELNQGQFSEVIESPSGFHILFLEDRRSSVLEKKIPSYKSRHILLKVPSVQDENLIRSRAQSIREDLTNGRPFEEIAKRHSDDDSTSEAGGDLGWAYPGDFVPKFENALRKLKIGEISQPIRSTYGYHIILLVDKREEFVSPERQRTMARMMIRESKLKESTDEWVRELRANSYVDIKKIELRL